MKSFKDKVVLGYLKFFLIFPEITEVDIDWEYLFLLSPRIHLSNFGVLEALARAINDVNVYADWTWDKTRQSEEIMGRFIWSINVDSMTNVILDLKELRHPSIDIKPRRAGFAGCLPNEVKQTVKVLAINLEKEILKLELKISKESLSN